mmetsp:Transcript_47769/g.132782  ORF Transcript_47769/g.132782 Transcript_47769/m.132782 type:complete len:254 (+) Transcript_47769:705-1466(+)
MGAGATGQGASDAAQILKPSLARGDLHLVGATTLDEYRRHIEKDQALTRRFQTVYVPEPTVEDTVAILRGLKSKYEVHHGVAIQDDALIAAAQLSGRFLAERKQPDKSIDLIDEAASRLKVCVVPFPCPSPRCRPIARRPITRRLNARRFASSYTATAGEQTRRDLRARTSAPHQTDRTRRNDAQGRGQGARHVLEGAAREGRGGDQGDGGRPIGVGGDVGRREACAGGLKGPQGRVGECQSGASHGGEGGQL